MKKEKSRKRNQFIDDAAEVRPLPEPMRVIAFVTVCFTRRVHIIAAQTAREDLHTSRSDPASRSRDTTVAPPPAFFAPNNRRTRATRKKSGRKKKKRTGASAFIDDIAEEEDADDDDDEDEEGEEEDLDEVARGGGAAQQRIHARYQNMENMELHGERTREADQGEVCAATWRGVRRGRRGQRGGPWALHIHGEGSKLWLVTVKQGKEETVVCLMQRLSTCTSPARARWQSSPRACRIPSSPTSTSRLRGSLTSKALQGMRPSAQAHQTGAHYRDGGLHHRHQEEGREHPVPIMGEDAAAAVTRVTLPG